MSRNEITLLALTALIAFANLLTAAAALWNSRTAAQEFRCAQSDGLLQEGLKSF